MCARLSASGSHARDLEQQSEGRRLNAITKILNGATPKSYEALQLHLVWAGDYALSALSDDCLALDSIWPNSLPPQRALADEATLVARDAAAQSHRDLITKGVTVKPMEYEELLTPKQHEQVVDKICSNIEDSTLHLADRNQWAAAKPKMEQWLAAGHTALGPHHASMLRSRFA